MIDVLGLAGLLPAAPGPAGARARRRGGGARAGFGARAAAAGARARVVGVLDRLLPHRALAHRPDRQRPVPRALPQRGAQRAAGHRSGLPARRAREADPARARPLRQGALGAGGGVSDVPLARGDPRARQGARAAGGGARAGGARVGAVGGQERGARRRGRDGDGALRRAGPVHRSRRARGRVRHEHERVAGDGQRQAARPGRGARDRPGVARTTTACPGAGRGWRGCATRPTGCRAISPSTRAG